MKLEVIQAPDSSPWYKDGLKFTCTQCGNCCTGPAGFVWISDEEIDRLARHLNMTAEQVRQTYCRSIGGRTSLREHRNAQGAYDCIFLKEIRTRSRDGLPRVQRICGIYASRPLQCRTWPFWEGNLASRENWDRSAKRCHGMNHGRRSFGRQEIEGLRDATDWPDHPPTSGRK